MVDKGLLEWTTPVHDILPEMSQKTWLTSSKLTVIDLLSHRTGTAWGDALYLQSNNNILLPKADSIRTFESLDIVAPPRSKWMYNNHAYNIVGLVIEKLSGQNWGDFVKEHLFDPLAMSRTFTSQPEDVNVALSYNILHDGTPFRISFCEASDQTMMFAGQSVRSSMADLLVFYQAYIEAMLGLTDQPTDPSHSDFHSQSRKPGTHHSSGYSSWFGFDKFCANDKGLYSSNPIKQIATIIRPQIARPIDSLSEQTYALGWHRTQLPGKLEFGANLGIVDSMPSLGEAYPGKLAIWHGGNMPGTSAAVCLLPYSQTGIVVLQNSLGLCDATEWTCHLILDTIFARKLQHDYITLARGSAKNGVERMRKVQNELDRDHIPGTNHRPLAAYTGNYWNSIRNWVIEISLGTGGEGLDLKFQGREDERYSLRHYHNDIFVWNMPYDSIVMRAQYIRPIAYYKIEFVSNKKEGEGGISHVRWRHDPYVPDGQTFAKTD